MKIYRLKLRDGSEEDLTITKEVTDRIIGLVRIEKMKVSFVNEFKATCKALAKISNRDVVNYKVMTYPADKADEPVADYKTRAANDGE